MTPETRLLVRVSAALPDAPSSALDDALDRAASAVREGRLGAAEVEEALLQSYLFVGFPSALTALRRWRSVSGRSAAASPPEREGGEAPEEPERLEAWRRRGEAVCRRVYGPNYRKLRDNVSRLHPDMDRWMVLEGYGKVLGRPGLDLARRELCVVGLLAVTRWRPQLHSHLRGALNAGASADSVEAALDVALEGAEDDHAEAVRALWRRVRPGTASEGGAGPTTA